MIRCDFATTTKAVVGLVPGEEEPIRPMCRDGISVKGISNTFGSCWLIVLASTWLRDWG